MLLMWRETSSTKPNYHPATQNNTEKDHHRVEKRIKAFSAEMADGTSTEGPETPTRSGPQTPGHPSFRRYEQFPDLETH